MSSKIGIHFLKSFFVEVIWDIFNSWRATCHQQQVSLQNNFATILAKFSKTFSVNFCQIFHKRCGQICQQKFSANFGRPWAATKISSCQNQICENKAVWERDEANPVCQISFEMIRGRANTHISVLYQANLICQIGFEMMEQIHIFHPVQHLDYGKLM